jgi:hypothetical protein
MDIFEAAFRMALSTAPSPAKPANIATKIQVL